MHLNSHVNHDWHAITPIYDTIKDIMRFIIVSLTNHTHHQQICCLIDGSENASLREAIASGKFSKVISHFDPCKYKVFGFLATTALVENNLLWSIRQVLDMKCNVFNLYEYITFSRSSFFRSVARAYTTSNHNTSMGKLVEPLVIMSSEKTVARKKILPTRCSDSQTLPLKQQSSIMILGFDNLLSSKSYKYKNIKILGVTTANQNWRFWCVR